ncbi:hypothetical protein RHSIM_Rhsim04G0094000 [Rhododendron simsii]|uniref:Uncharacterized protein n=1 Tax=Rhododendron simsii TaxID=118357 RepID=A0A834H092_RHOSS|nr:hypothetical protein RHSIM_Rhsim04G0094000 [Rhododendron simsii]
MGGGKQEKRSKRRRTPKNENANKQKRIPLGPNRVLAKKKKAKTKPHKNHRSSLGVATAAKQLSFFVDQYQSANGVQLSALELKSIKAEKCILELSQGMDLSASNLGEHMKAAFGSSWKEVLCEKQLLEGKIDPGSPALLVISLSALRSLELRSLFECLRKECIMVLQDFQGFDQRFSKHMKVEEQEATSSDKVGGVSYRVCKTEKNLGRILSARMLLPLILARKMLLACWLSRGEVLGVYRALLDVERPEGGLLRGWNLLVVAVLKNRVNIACGLWIKKLINVEALGLSVAVIALDMHTDVKGYSLFTLPQVRLFLLLPLPFTIVLSYAIGEGFIVLESRIQYAFSLTPSSLSSTCAWYDHYG